MCRAVSKMPAAYFKSSAFFEGCTHSTTASPRPSVLGRCALAERWVERGGEVQNIIGLLIGLIVIIILVYIIANLW